MIYTILYNSILLYFNERLKRLMLKLHVFDMILSSILSFKLTRNDCSRI